MAPFLFTVYTADFYRQSTHCHLQKFSDDSAVISLIRDGDDRAHREVINNFVDWRQRNHLQLNARKTKELVVDFCWHKQPCTQVNIQGTDIEIVTSYKYLGVHMNNKLDWTDHTAATYKKVQSRLHLLEASSTLDLLLTQCRWWERAG